MQSVRPTGAHMQQAGSAPLPDKIEPIEKAKLILPQLKEALVKLMQVSSQNVAVSISIDDMQKGVDGSTIPSFSKCLEQFYSLCDQLELQLNLAYQQLSQGLLSVQHVPTVATYNFRLEPKASSVYASYSATVDTQLRVAKEVHELLSNCIKKLSEHHTSHVV